MKIENQSLQLVTHAQIQKFTHGQKGLLHLIEDCVKNNKPCDFEAVVLCYCKSVRKTYYHEKRNWNYKEQKWDYEYPEHDVYKCFQEQNHIWTYRLRSLIKQWFVNTIGVLVLKGKLIVLPIIEIE